MLHSSCHWLVKTLQWILWAGIRAELLTLHDLAVSLLLSHLSHSPLCPLPFRHMCLLFLIGVLIALQCYVSLLYNEVESALCTHTEVLLHRGSCTCYDSLSGMSPIVGMALSEQPNNTVLSSLHFSGRERDAKNFAEWMDEPPNLK